MTTLGLTSSSFIQALVDFVFVPGRKPPLYSLPSSHLRQGIDGLPLTLFLSQKIRDTMPSLDARHCLWTTMYWEIHDWR